MHPLIPYFEPFSFPIGPVSIHGFGILVAIGFLVGGNTSMKYAAKFSGDPRAAERINRLVGWLVIGTFVGGHVGHLLFYEPQLLLEDPMKIFKVWEGLSSYGGFLVCVPLCLIFFAREKVNPWPYLDGLSVGMAIGWFFGRMGCFSAHDHPGAQTEFWLGVYGMCSGNNPTVACHDLGLYEAIWSGSLYLLFLVLARKPRFHGLFLGLIALLYGPFRFFLDFTRSSPIDVRYFGLTPAQYGSVLVAALGVWILVTRSKTGVRPVATAG